MHKCSHLTSSLWAVWTLEPSSKWTTSVVKLFVYADENIAVGGWQESCFKVVNEEQLPEPCRLLRLRQHLVVVVQWALDSFDELQLAAKHCLYSEDVYYGSSRHPGGFLISTEAQLQHWGKTESGNLFYYNTLQGRAWGRGTWGPIHHCVWALLSAGPGGHVGLLSTAFFTG